jgi:hypothetical protein
MALLLLVVEANVGNLGDGGTGGNPGDDGNIWGDAKKNNFFGDDE